ncbi:hypothetical protein ACS0TY_003719 [Phlomoides rotata]
MVSKFPLDHEINSKIYLWRGNPWNLENLDEAHSSPGLHVAAGPGLAEECATLIEYEEFKVRINAFVTKAQKVHDGVWNMQDGKPWPGDNVRDHPGMIQVKVVDMAMMERICLAWYMSLGKKGLVQHEGKFCYLDMEHYYWPL